MNDIRVLKIKSGDSRSCNCCRARNYESSVNLDIGEIVDVLYELCIDHAHIALCEKCLAKVAEVAGAIVGITNPKAARPLYEVVKEVVDTPVDFAICDDLAYAERARRLLAAQHGWDTDDIEILEHPHPLNCLFLGEKFIDLTSEAQDDQIVRNPDREKTSGNIVIQVQNTNHNQ